MFDFDKLNSSLGGLKFGTDGDGNVGYYGADGSLIPFKNAKLITPDNGVQIVDFGFKPQYFIAIQNTAGYYIIYDLENNKQIDNHNVPFDPTATSVSFDKNFFIFNQNKTGLEKIYYYSTAWKWHICVL